MKNSQPNFMKPTEMFTKYVTDVALKSKINADSIIKFINIQSQYFLLPCAKSNVF